MSEKMKYYYETGLGVLILVVLFLSNAEIVLGNFLSGIIGLPLVLIAFALLWDAWNEYFSKS